jgi:hypothetical protein
MANGLTGVSGYDLAQNVDTLIYTCPVDKLATVVVSLCNRGANETSVRLATGGGSNPANTDYYEYDATLPPKGVLERGGIILSPGDKVWVRSNSVSVTAKIHGIEG